MFLKSCPFTAVQCSFFIFIGSRVAFFKKSHGLLSVKRTGKWSEKLIECKTSRFLMIDKLLLEQKTKSITLLPLVLEKVKLAGLSPRMRPFTREKLLSSINSSKMRPLDLKILSWLTMLLCRFVLPSKCSGIRALSPTRQLKSPKTKKARSGKTNTSLIEICSNSNKHSRSKDGLRYTKHKINLKF